MAWWIKSEATQKRKSILEIEQNGCSECPVCSFQLWSYQVDQFFYISLVIDRLFILSLNEQQNPMQIWMWTLSMRSNRGFKSRHRLFNLSFFFCIFCPFNAFHFWNVKKECKSLTTTNFIIRITEYNKFYASSIGISIQIEAIWSV